MTPIETSDKLNCPQPRLPRLDTPHHHTMLSTPHYHDIYNHNLNSTHLTTNHNKPQKYYVTAWSCTTPHLGSALTTVTPSLRSLSLFSLPPFI
jgi:hypothetical protein